MTTDAYMSGLRRKNILLFIKRNKLQMKEFAAKAGLSPSHLSQMVGRNGSRPITEAMVRLIESRLGLDVGVFDRDASRPATGLPILPASLSLLERVERLERAVGVV